jgi:hypothetical protein
MMAGFRKAQSRQAALKMGLYGPQGSGKTFTALLCAEGLAAHEGKRVAYVDTEHGTDFYSMAVPERQIHPQAFDFDALYTRSLFEALEEIKKLSASEYSVVVIDSMTHLWEAAIAAYAGRTTRAGTIPLNAWGKIKRPYKDLMSVMLSSQMHFVICGRQGTVFAEDDSGEMKAVGVKMKAEGETPYEPHILIAMDVHRDAKARASGVAAFVEKDRTGVLSGKTIINPTFATLMGPILPLLNSQCVQAHTPTIDETASADVERSAQIDSEKESVSKETLERWKATIVLADSPESLKAIGKQITPALKARMNPSDVAALRNAYLAREAAISGKPVPPQDSDPDPDDDGR